MFDMDTTTTTMYGPLPTTTTPDGLLPTDSGDSVVTLDQVPRWSDSEFRLSYEIQDLGFPTSYSPDPLASSSGAESSGNGMVSRFPVDHEVNSKIYLWRGNPWNLEVDAVNSTNEIYGGGIYEQSSWIFSSFVSNIFPWAVLAYSQRWIGTGLTAASFGSTFPLWTSFVAYLLHPLYIFVPCLSLIYESF